MLKITNNILDRKGIRDNRFKLKYQLIEKISKYGGKAMNLRKTLKRLLIIMAFCIIITSFFGFKYEVHAAVKKGKTYDYTIYGKEIEIVKYKGKAAKVVIPSKIEGKEVTAIDSHAFAGNNYIKKVIIPDGINEIRSYAFLECKNLSYVTMPKSIKVISEGLFSGCKSLKYANIPDKVETIEFAAFSGCESLKSINFPKNLEAIGSQAYEECKSLKEIVLPDGLSTIGHGAFSDCEGLEKVIMPSSIKTLPDGCFSECKNLKEVILPEDMMKIGQRTFYNCKSLSLIHLPKNINAIGREAFFGCSSITSIVFPEGLSIIGGDAFAGCEKIDSITLPASVTFEEGMSLEERKEVILKHPFMGCTSLKEVNVSPDNKLFMSDKGVLYSKDKAKLFLVPPSYEEEYIIPDSVTDIVEGAFAYQKVLNKITIPNTITHVGAAAFYHAESLKKISLNNVVKEFYEYTFFGSGIEEITIPDGVKRLGEQIFSNCPNLKKITLPVSLERIGVGYDFWPLIGDSINLEEIAVAEGNPNYFSKDGVLYYKHNYLNRTYIVCYPAAKKGESFTVPKGTYIGAFAFDSCKYLRKVVIPEGITSLYAVFSDCKDLVVWLPRSITELPSSGHTGDFPIFRNSEGCFAMVRKGSAVHKYCKENNFPYKVIG
jgi:hypothetical protein